MWGNIMSCNYVNTRLYEFHYDIHVNGFGKSRQLYAKIICIGVGGGDNAEP